AQTMSVRGTRRVGKNLVYVFPGRIGENRPPAEERRSLHFTLDDVKALRASALRADRVSAMVEQWMHARHGTAGHNILVRGVEPDMRDLRGVTLAAGRFVGRDDQRFGRRVAVLGDTARKRLFGPQPAGGPYIVLSGQRLEGAGRPQHIRQQLAHDGPDLDEQIWVPVTTLMTLLDREYVDQILLRPSARQYNDELKREMHLILNRRLHVAHDDREALSIISLVDTLAAFDVAGAAINRFMVLVTLTTLMIGGIGGMNMMLASVNERRRGIGLR